MKYTISSIVLMCTAIFVSSCKQETETVNLNYQYKTFPIDSGRYFTYFVDSTSIHPVSHVKTRTTFELKEVYDQNFTDAVGRNSVRIYQYKRLNASAPWTYVNTAFATIANDRAERVENNLRFIKMIFPIHQRQNWYSNIHIAETPETWYFYENSENFWKNKYTRIFTSDNINNTPYDSVVTILQVDNETQINKFYSLEKYAPNLGMIYREQLILDDASVTDNEINIPIYDRADKGFSVKMYLIDHN